MQRVILSWHEVGPERDDRWLYSRTVYAYLAPRVNEVLYIGKADGCTVRERWVQKRQFWSDLEQQRNLKSHRVIVADWEIPDGSRMTRELLADVESLLIFEVKPWGNVQAQSSRTSRPGLIVECRGKWPLTRRIFRDG
jgi:hypothetical protein